MRLRHLYGKCAKKEHFCIVRGVRKASAHPARRTYDKTRPRPNANISNLTHPLLSGFPILIHLPLKSFFNLPLGQLGQLNRKKFVQRERGANQTTKVNKKRNKNGNNIGKNQFSI